MNSSWLPAGLTQMSHSVDSLFYIMLGIVTFFFVLVEVLLITFLIRYRRTKKNQVGVNVHGNNFLEILWTLVPAAILVAVGAYSVRFVYDLQTPPAQPEVIKVTGHEWFWEFQYPNGVKTKNDLRVPAGEHVLFQITSADVIHGFYIPSTRIQQDALPGRITSFSITAQPSEVGQVVDVPCDQFCGSGHSIMDAKLTVMTPSDYNSWLATEKQKSDSGS